MSFADNLRTELNNKNAEIIATRFAPRKAELLETIAKGIRRIGYVEIDTLCNAGTYEGDCLGVNRGEIDAFAEFVKAEGFKASRRWWGYSSEGQPDMLKIYL